MSRKAHLLAIAPALADQTEPFDPEATLPVSMQLLARLCVQAEETLRTRLDFSIVKAEELQLGDEDPEPEPKK